MSQPHYQPKENRETVLDYTILCYDAVPSTNELAKEIAKKNVEERIVVVAEEQTMGKGRLNRQWISPRGGLWLSIVMRPRISPKEAVKLNFMTSSAVARTIQGMFGLRTEVKWPNDVLVNGRKICGILTESNNKGDGVDFVVVGIGANVNVDLEAFPKGLRDSVTSLKHELGYEVDRKSLTTSPCKTLKIVTGVCSRVCGMPCSMSGKAWRLFSENKWKLTVLKRFLLEKLGMWMMTALSSFGLIMVC